jgi:hypothetical protein
MLGFSEAARGVLIDDGQAVARILAQAVEESSTASCFSEWRKTMTSPLS